MFEDPIVEEIRAVRQAHAAKFDYDFDRIFQDLLEMQKNLNHPLVSREEETPPKEANQ